MQRIDTSRAIPDRPAAAAGGDPGYFTGGDPATGFLPTQLDPEWCNGIQENLMRVILAAGIAPAKGPAGDTNLLQALGSLARIDAGLASTGPFVVTFESTYTLDLTHTPAVAGRLFIVSMLTSGPVQPVQATPARGSLNHALLVNGIILAAYNTQVGSTLFGLVAAPAGVAQQMQSRLVTVQPPSPYVPSVGQQLAYLFLPW